MAPPPNAPGKKKKASPLLIIVVVGGGTLAYILYKRNKTAQAADACGHL